jgi:cation transporter-like permease
MTHNRMRALLAFLILSTLGVLAFLWHYRFTFLDFFGSLPLWAHIVGGVLSVFCYVVAFAMARAAADGDAHLRVGAERRHLRVLPDRRDDA